MFCSVLLPSLPSPFPRPHTCIGSETRLLLREGSTAQAAMTSLCYDSCEFHWNERRPRHIHVKKVYSTHCFSTLKQCTTYCEFQSMGTVVIFLMCHLVFWIANLVYNMTFLALGCAKLLLASINDVLVIANWTPWSFLCTWFCHIGHTEKKKVRKSP